MKFLFIENIQNYPYVYTNSEASINYLSDHAILGEISVCDDVFVIDLDYNKYFQKYDFTLKMFVEEEFFPTLKMICDVVEFEKSVGDAHQFKGACDNIMRDKYGIHHSI